MNACHNRVEPGTCLTGSSLDDGDCPATPAGDYQGGVITAKAYARFAREWVAAGATVVGGCCGIGPEQIRAVRAAVQRGTG